MGFFFRKYDKSSAALLRIMGKLPETVETFEQMTFLVMIAQISWNSERLPPKERKKLLEKILKQSSKEERLGVTRLCHFFIEQKSLLYPSDKRVFVDARVTDQGNSFHLQVATLYPEEDRQNLRTGLAPKDTRIHELPTSEFNELLKSGKGIISPIFNSSPPST